MSLSTENLRRALGSPPPACNDGPRTMTYRPKAWHPLVHPAPLAWYYRIDPMALLGVIACALAAAIAAALFVFT